MADIGKAFTYPFRDPAWVQKFLKGAGFMVLGIFVIGIFVVVGYFVQVTQRVMRGEEQTMPEWSDVGVKFVLGFKFFIVYLVYALPAILLCIPLALAAALGASGPFVSGGVFVSVLVLAYLLVVVPYSLALTTLLPIITCRFAAHESIAEALNLAEVLRLFRRNWKNTAVVALIAVGVHLFAAVGIVMFLVGMLFTTFYAYIVSSYLYGTLVAEGSVEGQAA